jgi:hypothetical protein
MMDHPAAARRARHLAPDAPDGKQVRQEKAIAGTQQVEELARGRHYSSTKSAAAHKAAFTKKTNATVR